MQNVSNDLLLDEAAAAFALDPLGMVQFDYPWGEPGPLEAWDGPDTWQIDALETIREALEAPDDAGAVRIAIGSGHGIGKGTLMAWLVRWFICTRPNPQMVVTANTATQLTTKTWREVAKWHRLSQYQERFEWTQTYYRSRVQPATWYAAAIPWSEEKPEAFQGAHDRYVFFGFDEASAIPDLIWDTAEGSMTTANSLWVCTGNLTRPTGRFTEIFPGGRFAHRWKSFRIDARTARMTNKVQIAQWLVDYGEDSDFFRVRVKGEKPKQAVGQFISDDLVEKATDRHVLLDPVQPILISADVARYGDDRSVILVRQGAILLEIRLYEGQSTTRFTGYLCEVINAYTDRSNTTKPTVFVDGVGIGAGVIDQARDRGYRIEEVLGNATPLDPVHYVNLRAEMWDKMRRWLDERGTLIPRKILGRDAATYQAEVKADLTGIEYDYDTGKLRLEKKEDMKSRGLASPDIADALAQTFAFPVALQTMPEKRPPVVRTYRPPGVTTGTSWMR